MITDVTGLLFLMIPAFVLVAHTFFIMGLQRDLEETQRKQRLVNLAQVNISKELIRIQKDFIDIIELLIKDLK